MPDFNLLDCFKIFDTRGQGNVSVQDVITALKENLNFHDFTHDDVYLLFRRHDNNQDGKLNFQEFSTIIIPLSKEYAALLTDRPDFYMSRGVPLSQFFNHGTRNQLRTLWQSLFKVERSCETLRMNLRNRPYFNLKQAFSYLDTDLDGFLSLDDFREYLANNGFYATEREL
jgi:Ca2+-binding EF-hand superfamily protein